MEPASCHATENRTRYTPSYFVETHKKCAQWCATVGILLATLLVGNLLLPQQVTPSLLAFASSFPDVGSASCQFLVTRETVQSAVATGEGSQSTPNERRGRTAYVMLVHVLSQGVLDELQHLTSDLDGRDVFIIYDETEHPFSGVSELNGLGAGGFFTSGSGLFGGVVVVNKEGLRRISPWFESAHEHIQTLLVAFYRSVMENDPGYTYVWFLESDVRCNGNYNRTFARGAGLEADFLGLWTVARTGDHDMALLPWNWDRLEGVPMGDRWGAFLPVMRLSRRGLRALSAAAARDVTGFCEVYIPTMVHEAGGAMGSLPDGMLAPGGYRYRPQMTQAEYEAVRRDGPTDALYHPVLG